MTEKPVATPAEALELALDTLARSVVEELRLHDDNYGDEYFENLKYSIRQYGDARAAIVRGNV